ncbi:MAG TPA: FUSC family protein [Acetobacteraceae bacterium]|nr:FUSC family protein [Acetobacteraceae bacterium]
MFAAQSTEWAESATSRARRLLADGLITWGPPLTFGLRLWLSVCLALYLAFWLQLDNPYWAGTSAAIVCQPQLGASLRKGWFRMIGTVIGAVVSVEMTACFPQDRALFLGSLALWGGVCAMTATLLRNFAAYAAALAGYTAAIIASDQLGAAGGVNGDAFMLAITRASEICIGIVAAGVVLACTDLGGAPRRLAARFANLSADIMSRFIGSLATARPNLPDTQTIRREFTRQVIALDPIIDQSFGESSRLRYHSPILQQAVDGLFAALAAWRAVADHLAQLPDDQPRQQADKVLQNLSPELRGLSVSPDPTHWIADPTALLRIYETAARRLVNLPVDTPSRRLLFDQTARVLAGIADALNGLALLVADPARALPRRGFVRPRVPDWLPALVNAGRACVTIGAVELFWIATAWPNGAGAITFAAITAILLAPRADQAYVAALGFALGSFLAAICAAIINFLLLPGLRPETFLGFSLVIGLYLIPSGALMAQPWMAHPWLTGLFVAATANFVPILAPANQMSYDTVQFYNQALAIVAGAATAAVSFRLLPPLSPAFRTRRLLALTLHDLRRLAREWRPSDWQGRVDGRLSTMPDQATPLQRAQLLAARSAGSAIIQLRHVARQLGLSTGLEPAFAAVAKGNSGVAIAHLARLDAALVTRGDTGPEWQATLRARSDILALSEVLTQHPTYFDAGAPG